MTRYVCKITALLISLILIPGFVFGWQVGHNGDLEVKGDMAIHGKDITEAIRASGLIDEQYAHQVEVANGIAVFGTAQGALASSLWIYDMESMTQIAEVDFNTLWGGAYKPVAFQIRGHYIYGVANTASNGRAFKIDFSDPSNPVVTNTGDDSVYVGTHVVTLAGEYLLSCTYDAGAPEDFVITDITNPTPKKISSQTVSWNGCHELFLDGKWLIEASWADGVTAEINVYDASEIFDGDDTYTLPAATDTLTGSDNAAIVGINRIVSNGGKYFYGISTSTANDAFVVIDREDMTALAVESSLDLSSYGSVPENITLAYPYAYIGFEDSTGTLLKLDISDPTAVTVVDSIVNATVYQLMANTAVEGGFLYFMARDSSNTGYPTKIDIGDGIVSPVSTVGSGVFGRLNVNGFLGANELSIRNSIYAGDSGINTSGPVTGNRGYFYNSDSFGLQLSGWDYDEGANTDSGCLRLGANSSWSGIVCYDGEMTGSLKLINTYDTALAEINIITYDGSGNQITGLTVTSAGPRKTPPTTQVIADAETITADACFSFRNICAGTTTCDDGASTVTNTTNTFGNCNQFTAGCIMTVQNLGVTYNVTLDANSNFDTVGGTDIVLAPKESVQVGCNNSVWRQTGTKQVY